MSSFALLCPCTLVSVSSFTSGAGERGSEEGWIEGKDEGREGRRRKKGGWVGGNKGEERKVII